MNNSRSFFLQVSSRIDASVCLHLVATPELSFLITPKEFRDGHHIQYTQEAIKCVHVHFVCYVKLGTKPINSSI